MTRWIRWAFFVMAGVLLASSLFLIVNTIRLATFARRREIEVMKLVGASNWFVRVPFMAEGLVQGAIGAGFAVGLVYFLKWIITKLLKHQHNLLQPFYASSHDVFVIGASGVRDRRRHRRDGLDDRPAEIPRCVIVGRVRARRALRSGINAVACCVCWSRLAALTPSVLRGCNRPRARRALGHGASKLTGGDWQVHTVTSSFAAGFARN